MVSLHRILIDRGDRRVATLEFIFALEVSRTIRLRTRYFTVLRMSRRSNSVTNNVAQACLMSSKASRVCVLIQILLLFAKWWRLFRI